MNRKRRPFGSPFFSYLPLALLPLDRETAPPCLGALGCVLGLEVFGCALGLVAGPPVDGLIALSLLFGLFCGLVCGLGLGSGLDSGFGFGAGFTFGFGGGGGVLL